MPSAEGQHSKKIAGTASRQHAEPLPFVAAADLPRELDHPGGRWLIDGLWAAQGVGLIGGAPKCCKTWLALDLAVSVASATDALGRFPVIEPGGVLLYAAEDALGNLRERLEAICAARHLGLGQIDMHLITADSLRLDTRRDLERLGATIEQTSPRMLVLDPLVRMHRCDENSAADMAALLGELRSLQRAHGLAIVLVHHLRKNGSVGQPGQALRGSGDLHAWGDSNLYLRRRDRTLRMTVEHRSAPSPEPFDLELAQEPTCHLRLIHQQDGPDPRATSALAERIVTVLEKSEQPVGRKGLREKLKVRNESLGQALIRLRDEDRIERCEGGFRIQRSHRGDVPVPTLRDRAGTERQTSLLNPPLSVPDDSHDQ